MQKDIGTVHYYKCLVKDHILKNIKVKKQKINYLQYL